MEIPEHYELTLVLNADHGPDFGVIPLINPEPEPYVSWDQRKQLMLSIGGAEGVAHYLFVDVGETLSLVDQYGDNPITANRYALELATTKNAIFELAIAARRELRRQQAANDLAPNPVSSEERSSEY